MQIGNLDVGGDLTANANNGNIVQVNGTTIDVSGLTTLNASGDITLDSTTNNFTTLALNATNATIVDGVGGIILDNITTSGNFDIKSLSGDITQSSGKKIIVDGITTLDAATNDIVLSNQENDFKNTVNANGKNVTLADANGIELGNITTSEDLIVNAKNDITQTSGTALTTAGNASLNSTSGDITLNSPTNKIDGNLSMSGNKVTVDNYNHALTLGDVRAKTSLDITTNNKDINQANGTSIISDGITTLDSGNADINLDNATNDFKNTVNANGKNVTLADVNSVKLGDINTNKNLNLNTNGNITQTIESIVYIGDQSTFNATLNHDVILKNNTNIFNGLVNITANSAIIAAESRPFWGKINTRIPTVYLVAQKVEDTQKLITPIVNATSTKVNENINIKVGSNNSKKADFKAPAENQPTKKVTQEELNTIQNTQDTKITLNDISNIQIIGSGINLPEGLSQEFYLSDDNLRRGK